SQLAEIGDQSEPVRDAAVQAEPERCRQEMTLESIIRLVGVAADSDRTRELLPTGGPHANRRLMVFEPVVGESVQDGLRIGWLRLQGADMEKAGVASLVVLKIRQRSRREDPSAPGGIDHHANRVVFLATLATEDQAKLKDVHGSPVADGRSGPEVRR